MDSRPGILATPLGQFGLGALALVVGAALLFTLIGAVSGEADDADPDTAETFASTDAPTDGGTTPAGDPGAPTDGATDATTAPTEGADTPTDTPTQSETPTETTPAVDPASITIQVLGGADLAADEDAVISCLEGAGYSDLITGNRARVSYDTTTIFYSGDARAEAQQVADTLGVASVEQQPGNLSEDVPVHVVAGNDGSDLC